MGAVLVLVMGAAPFIPGAPTLPVASAHTTQDVSHDIVCPMNAANSDTGINACTSERVVGGGEFEFVEKAQYVSGEWRKYLTRRWTATGYAPGATSASATVCLKGYAEGTGWEYMSFHSETQTSGTVVSNTVTMVRPTLSPAARWTPDYWWYDTYGVGCSGADPGAPITTAHDVPAPLYSCARTIGVTSTGLPRARFTVAQEDDGEAYFVDTFSWDFGDTATSELAEPSHVYGGSYTDGGWTATVTVTRTLTDEEDHDFEDSSTDPKTFECALRVDPENPSESEAETTGSEDTDDSDCPSGWGWLNPAAIASILRCLFIPTTETSDSWDDFTTAAEESYPFGPVLFAGEEVAQVYRGFEYGVQGGIDTGGPVNPGDSCTGTIVEVETPVGDLPLPDIRIPYSGEGCSESEIPDFIQDAQGVTRGLSVVGMWVGFLFFVKRKVESLMGGSDGGDA